MCRFVSSFEVDVLKGISAYDYHKDHIITLIYEEIYEKKGSCVRFVDAGVDEVVGSAWDGRRDLVF